MSLDKEIQELVEIYYSLISWDHHKQRDLCFYVATFYTPDVGITHKPYHDGYLNSLDSIECSSFEEAQRELKHRVISFCLKELKWLMEANDLTPEERREGWIAGGPFTRQQLEDIRNKVESYK